MIGRVSAVAGLVLVVGIAFHGEARSEERGAEACLACHGIEGFAGPGERALFISGDEFSASVHGFLACTGCHVDADEIPHAERLARAEVRACAACHSDTVAAYGSSVHGEAYRRADPEAPACTGCHGPAHAVKRTTDPNSPTYPLNLPRTCAACHANPELAERHGIPVASAYRLYMDSIHGRALTRSGLLVAANCSTCHGAHDILRMTDPKSKVYRVNVPATCGSCHAGIEQEYFRGVHGQGLRKRNLRVPVCVDCHSAHHISRVDAPLWKLQAVRECGSCHREALKTYRDTFHGQVTALGFTRVARCSDCHGAHRILAASDPGSSVSPANLVSTCRQCHPKANKNFVRFSPHADPRDKERNPGLYTAHRMMILLMVGVFVFFGLHTFLWLLRSLFASRGRRAAAGEK